MLRFSDGDQFLVLSSTFNHLPFHVYERYIEA